MRGTLKTSESIEHDLIHCRYWQIPSFSQAVIRRFPNTVNHPDIGQLSKLPSNQPVTVCHRGNKILGSSADWHLSHDLWHKIYLFMCNMIMIYEGGHKTCLNTHLKNKNMGANSKFNYWFPISTEFVRPPSTRRHQLGRKSPEKHSLCWILGCALRCDLTWAMSSWTVPVILRPSAPERATRSSFRLYNERGSIKN